jgi:hypothetical protein
MKKLADQTTDARLKSGETAFTNAMSGLKFSIELIGSPEPKAIQVVDSAWNKTPIRQAALRFGVFAEPPATSNKELRFCPSAEEE